MDSSDKVVENIIDYKAVFCNEKGQAVLWDLMKAAGFASINFDENPYKMAYNEGLRAMVVRILNLTNMDIEEITRRIKDHKQKERIYGSGNNII